MLRGDTIMHATTIKANNTGHYAISQPPFKHSAQ